MFGLCSASEGDGWFEKYVCAPEFDEVLRRIQEGTYHGEGHFGSALNLTAPPLTLRSVRRTGGQPKM